MSDGTQLNVGTGGDLILTEDCGLAGGKVQTTKIVLGARGSDGGDVSASNPLPSKLTDGTNAVVVASSLPASNANGIVVREAAQGQKTMANSSPVVLASDQSSIPVDTELPAATTLADSTSNPSAPLVGACNELWDGSNWNRQTGHLTGLVLSSQSRTGAAFATLNISNRNCRGIHVILNITSNANSVGCSLFIDAIDNYSGVAYSILGATAVSATGIYAYEVYPGATGTVIATTAGTVVQRLAASMPPLFLLLVAHNDASHAVTYSLSYTLLI